MIPAFQPIKISGGRYYSLTKGLAEQRAIAANSPELTTVVVRPRLVWGQGDTTLLPQFVKAVRSGAFAWIDGGHYQTSTCHVRNVCEGSARRCRAGRGGEVYLLPTAQALSSASSSGRCCRRKV